MFEKIKQLEKYRKYATIQNGGLVLLGLVLLSVSWSSAKAIQKNIKLQTEADKLEQQIAITELEVKTKRLKNEFLKSDEFAELQARRLLGKAAPGEIVLAIPKSTSERYMLPPEQEKQAEGLTDNRPQALKNFSEWIDFFLNRKSTD